MKDKWRSTGIIDKFLVCRKKQPERRCRPASCPNEEGLIPSVAPAQRESEWEEKVGVGVFDFHRWGCAQLPRSLRDAVGSAARGVHAPSSPPLACLVAMWVQSTSSFRACKHKRKLGHHLTVVPDHGENVVIADQAGQSFSSIHLPNSDIHFAQKYPVPARVQEQDCPSIEIETTYSHTSPAPLHAHIPHI